MWAGRLTLNSKDERSTASVNCYILQKTKILDFTQDKSATFETTVPFSSNFVEINVRIWHIFVVILTINIKTHVIHKPCLLLFIVFIPIELL